MEKIAEFNTENEILKKDKSAKNFYMKTVNKFTYKIYCAIFSA